MVLAEALLRVPDAATADRLIEDKLAAGRWRDGDVKSTALLVSASAWTLGIAARVIHPGETPETILDSIVRRLGLPTVRAATRQAMRLLGSHFVLGQTIDEALHRARGHAEFRYSFDMLGEGARTAADADKYFDAYAGAIAAIGAQAGNAALPQRPGISVKLSALHPRYEAMSRERVLKELVPRLIALAQLARDGDLQFTVDAEEADRLELSLEIIAAVLGDASLRGWDGFGLAVQAYQKRALEVIDWVEEVAAASRRRLTVRLVKGAYWDTEIKRAQERGLADYPVFTRKAMTDLCYMACVKRLLAARDRLFPQFATHNALTVASVIEDAGGVEGFEFQRLYGMGEALYDALLAELPDAACRVYAPVGGHRDLLAYLVRRLLENGANSSFVSVAADPSVPIAEILRRPQSWIAGPQAARNSKIPLPRDIYLPERRGAAGVEFGDRASLDALLDEVRAGVGASDSAAPLIDGIALPGRERPVISPIDGQTIGTVREADDAIVISAMAAAAAGFPAWAATPVDERAAVLERAADRLEVNRGRLLALLQSEGGKTLDDALAELREAVDYCRYYAAQARIALAPQSMPGPTGESNELRYRGRGVFVCISPWNFPLAIFLGQVTAALVAGNTVVAKPAEQTPLIAALAVALLHDAGVPASALHLVPGDGAVGASLVADPRVAGVAFTGSTEIGRAINRALAEQKRRDRAADRRDRRHQRHDRRCHGAARTGDRRRRHLGVPLRRPALLGAAAAVPARRRRRAHARHADRRRARTESRRPARNIDPCRPGDRCRGQAKARPLDRREGARRRVAFPRRPRHGASCRRHLCRPDGDRARPRPRLEGRSVRPGAARGALARRRARRAARRHRRQRHSAHARHPFADRLDRRPHRRPACQRQRLRQSQHDRRRGRHPAVRRHPPVRHRAEGRRPELPAPLRLRADHHGQHRGRRRQCEPAGAGRMTPVMP